VTTETLRGVVTPWIVVGPPELLPLVGVEEAGGALLDAEHPANRPAMAATQATPWVRTRSLLNFMSNTSAFEMERIGRCNMDVAT
jgi:hypothetical protein